MKNGKSIRKFPSRLPEVGLNDHLMEANTEECLNGQIWAYRGVLQYQVLLVVLDEPSPASPKSLVRLRVILNGIDPVNAYAQGIAPCLVRFRFSFVTFPVTFA